MEETSLLAALPLYSCTGLWFSFLPFLMFRLSFLSATGAILGVSTSDDISKCHQRESKVCHIPVSAGAVAEGDDTPADPAVRWSERGARDEILYLRAI
jgi:hypothetical protein